ncbi:NUMOD4 domain-containing protein [Niabella ginsengisoli]|uniref:NUMOD4 domain-containing protein n=1 Tax=Niabella ginsengisoli TaxID=522298 RepID=A0ABS9SP74_9BACT|nr:NUMOD4 domain-containing protein [Niabella ginsengisoli]MCH5600081.1 NUMOD4 domain-containing protein [Niabella ginsengisoli]
MLRFFTTEKFKEISFEGNLQLRYAISNYGRLISYTNIPEEGRLLKGSTIKGYRIFRYKIRDKDNKLKHKHFFFYKLVAEYFLTKTSEDQVYVLHLDYNKMNDFAGNLKWAKREEMLQHQQASPYVLEARKKLVEYNKKRDGHKLTSTKVMLIKKRLADHNRKTRMKMIAKHFGISEMQLYRIKTGENWGHVKI